MAKFDYVKWVTENKYGKLQEISDIDLVQSNFLQQGANIPGDLNNDGIVNLADLTLAINQNSGPGSQSTPTPGAGSYSFVQSNEFPSELQSQHPGFNALSWAQNFQSTKVSPRVIQGGNTCNFLKNQSNKLFQKVNPMITAAMNAAGEETITSSTFNQLRQSNKHYDRLVIKVAMMQHMMFQNSCPF